MQAVLPVAVRSAESQRDAADQGRQCVTRDLSSRGLLIVTPVRFTLGERVRVTVNAGGVGVDVDGRVARVDENPISSPELWRWRVGVALDGTLPAALLEEGVRASNGSVRRR